MKNISAKIAILGCGWLGFPLGQKLKGEGYEINGSTTSDEKLSILDSAGIDPFLLEVLSSGIKGDISGFLTEAKILIIDFPPGGRSRPANDYISAMEQLRVAIEDSPVEKILFVSSISVYEDADYFPVYTEGQLPNALSDNGKAMIRAEEIIGSLNEKDVTILRLGGLIGKDRHPVYHLSGREGIPNPEAPVNLIHQQDCIDIIVEILRQDSFGEIYNAAFPKHPTRQEYYCKKAKEMELPLPRFERSGTKGKVISSAKLEKNLGFRFRQDIEGMGQEEEGENPPWFNRV